jgi:outer membrane protein assembly factor BamB
MGYNAATPIVDGQTIIYTGQGRGTHAVKIKKQGEGFAAEELWSNAELGTQFNTPVLKDGLLYGLSDRGNFFCVDAKGGKTAWTDSARRGNFGAIVDAGSVILALTSNSELTVWQPTDKAYTELARVKVSPKETYAHPIVAGKRMFVRDQDSVSLWTLEAPPASAPAQAAAVTSR